MNWRVALTSMNGGFPVGAGSLATRDTGLSLINGLLALDGRVLTLENRVMRLANAG